MELGAPTFRGMVFSDLHIHPHSGSHERIEQSMQALDWILEQYMSHQCDSLFFLGDWSHVPLHTHNLVISRTNEWLQKVEKLGIPLYVIVGNHDAPCGSHPEHGLPYMNNHAHVIDQKDQAVSIKAGNTNAIIHMIGWHNDLKEINVYDQGNGCHILLAHASIVGASMYTENVSEGLGTDYLTSKFSLTLCGHIHKHQEVADKVFHVGSLTTTKFGEDGPHGAMIFEVTQDAVQGTSVSCCFIENDVSPRHITVVPSQLEDPETELPELAAGQYVRLLVVPGDEVAKYRRLASSADPLQLVVKPFKPEEGDEKTIAIENDVVSLSKESIFRQFMKDVDVPEHLDREELTNTGIAYIERASK